MVGRALELKGHVGGQAVDVTAHSSSDWLEPILYAPAVPGIIVALIGLWISHALTRRRERRKEILELCDFVKGKAEAAVDASTEAWLNAPGEHRLHKVEAAKHRIQSLGISVTNLKNRSRKGYWHSIVCLFKERPLAINVSSNVASLRRIVTDDPFEDPNRAPDKARATLVSVVATELIARVDEQFAELYG